MERETARHCLPSAWWAEKGTEALAAEEGRPWVGASRTLLVTAGPTKRALFTPATPAPFRVEDRGRPSQGAPARHQGESWELATGKREPWSPYGVQPQAARQRLET